MDATSSTTAVGHSAGAFVSESRVVLTNLHRHADGIYTSAMANVYVRNSFFDSNGRSFVVRDGPAVETYEGADIFLAPSAGNSVRRCVSVNAGGAFVASPHHTAVNPATIEGCVVDGWRGAAAIQVKNLPFPPVFLRLLLISFLHDLVSCEQFEMRGPLTLLDNSFTNGSHPVSPHRVVDYSPWKQTNGDILFGGNRVDGKAVSSAELLPQLPSNVHAHDLQTNAENASPLSTETRFLKPSWPIPTALVNARDHGCTGTEEDSTTCAQKTIDAAAAKGDGAAAYFPAAVYKITAALTVKSGNYSVRGSGFETIFSWSSPSDPAPAVMHIQSGGAGLRLEQFAVVSGASLKAGTGHTPTILFEPNAGAAEAAEARGSGDRITVFDGIYTR